jgi:hypothetical protein
MIQQNVLVSKNQIVIRSIPYNLDKETWDVKILKTELFGIKIILY